jgi:HEAT repeat protein
MKSLRIALGATVALVLCILIVAVPWQSRPYYGPIIQGRALSLWLKEMSRFDIATSLRAKQVLTNLGSDSIPALIQMLKLPDRSPKSAYTAWRHNMPSFMSRWLPSTSGDGDNYICRYNAASVLGRFGSQAKVAVPDLVKLLNDPRTIVRFYGAEALGRIGPKASEALPALRAAKRSDGVFAAWALERIEMKTNGAAVIRQLVLAVSSDDKNVSEPAVAVLRDTGLARLALPPLLEELKTRGDYGNERCNAADLIALIGPEAKDAVTPLIDALNKSENAGGMDQAYIARALGMIGSEAKPAVSALLTLLKSDEVEDSVWRAQFAEAVQRIDPISAASAGIK